MLRIDNALDALINTIRADAYFSDIRVIKAYPFSAAPTRLAKETIVFGFDEITFSSTSVDESSRSGNLTVFADIFIPLKINSARAVDVFSQICRCFNGFNILSVRCERITVDVSTASYVLKTAFTFNNEIEVI